MIPSLAIFYKPYWIRLERGGSATLPIINHDPAPQIFIIKPTNRFFDH